MAQGMTEVMVHGKRQWVGKYTAASLNLYAMQHPRKLAVHLHPIDAAATYLMEIYVTATIEEAVVCAYYDGQIEV